MIILQTFGGIDYELTLDQVEKIQQQSTLGKTGGFWIGKDYIAFSAIKGIAETKQEINNYLKLPAGGKVISVERRNELLLKGLRKVRPNATLEDIKNFMKPKKQEIKYKNMDEAKAAGVKF